MIGNYGVPLPKRRRRQQKKLPRKPTHLPPSPEKNASTPTSPTSPPSPPTQKQQNHNQIEYTPSPQRGKVRSAPIKPSSPSLASANTTFAVPPRTAGNKYYRDSSSSSSDSDDSGIEPPTTPLNLLRNMRSSASSTPASPTPTKEAGRRETNYALIYPLNGPSPTKGPARADFLKRYHLSRPSQNPKKDTTRLFKRYAFLAQDEKIESPWSVKAPSKLEEVLLKWRFKRDDDYDNTWEKPLPPWITRDVAKKHAEEERENAERQLMLLEDLAMTELLERNNNRMLKLNRFCEKVAGWIMSKSMAGAWVKIDEHLSEEMEGKLMAAADVASRVEEKRHRKEIALAKQRFLSQKRLEYKKWIKGEKKSIKMVETFDKVKKMKIDWYCDNNMCEYRNFKLVYVCEMCGTKHDPSMDDEKQGGESFFKRRARRAQKQKLEDLATAIEGIVRMDEAIQDKNVGQIIGHMTTHPDSPNVQASGSDAMGSLTLDGKSSEVVQLDGLRVVVEAMDRFQGNVFVQRAAVKLLLNICLANDLEGMRTAYRAGVIPTVVAAMMDFPFDSIIQWVGCQIFIRLCFIDDDYGKMIYRSGGLVRLQRAWELRKSWSVKRGFRKMLSAAIHHLQTFAKGGSRHEPDRQSVHSASSLGSVDTFAYSTDADDTALEDSRRSSRASTAAKVEQEVNAQLNGEDVAELSEDEDEIEIESRIRGNITNLLVKKGWRVGRHPFVPECMESLFNSQKEFDLHRLDDMTQLYVPSRGNSRQGGSRGGSRGGGSRGGGIGSRASERSRPTSTETARTATPFFEPVNPDLGEEDRPMTRDRGVKWNSKIGMYVLSDGTLSNTPSREQSPAGGAVRGAKEVLSQRLGDLHISPVSSRQSTPTIKNTQAGTGTGSGTSSHGVKDARPSSRMTESRERGIRGGGGGGRLSPTIMEQKAAAAAAASTDPLMRKEMKSSKVVDMKDFMNEFKFAEMPRAGSPVAGDIAEIEAEEKGEDASNIMDTMKGLSNVFVVGGGGGISSLASPSSKGGTGMAASGSTSPPPRSALRRKSSFTAKTPSDVFPDDTVRPQSKVSFRLPSGRDAAGSPLNSQQGPGSPLKHFNEGSLNSAGHRIVFTPNNYEEFPMEPVNGVSSRGLLYTPLSVGLTGSGLGGGRLASPDGGEGGGGGGGKRFSLPIVPWDD